ncbi:MAG: cytochrome c oxidase assembly protein [Actinomycetota bacterium]|nr:cytochrome c oxidase assembly protein [Actinomycetota bacterium]
MRAKVTPVLAAAPSPWAFHAHPDVWLLVLVLGGGYGWAVRRKGPGSVSRKEIMLFSAGLLALWAGADYPVHDLSEGYLFSVHMVQHMVFSLIAPPLLLMGTPRWLLRALISPPAVLRAARFLTRPMVALIAFNVFVAVSHWPSLVDASLRSEALHFGLHFFLVVTSFMMWSPVVGRVEELPQLSPPAKMLYLFLQSVLPTVPASFLTFAERPIYHFYETVPHPWIDALTDNRIAGLTMKLGGGALLWGIIAVLFFKWHADEEASMEPSDVDGATWDDFERELEAWNLRT